MKWAFFRNKSEYFLKYNGGFGKADICTNTFLSFLEIIMFLSGLFKAGLVLNSRDLVYFKAVP